MVLAMAQAGLGQTDNAKVTLNEGIKFAEVHTPKTKTRDFGQGWSEWVVGQILMSEAKGLLSQKPAEQTQ
jgi:hypothetical protein